VRKKDEEEVFRSIDNGKKKRAPHRGGNSGDSKGFRPSGKNILATS
jgi:hypothetical protein